MTQKQAFNRCKKDAMRRHPEDRHEELDVVFRAAYMNGYVEGCETVLQAEAERARNTEDDRGMTTADYRAMVDRNRAAKGLPAREWKPPQFHAFAFRVAHQWNLGYYDTELDARRAIARFHNGRAA